jgi:hypothetical protein
MQKIIVFDLDETLGYFTQLGIFCDALDNCIEIKDSNIKFSDKYINNIMEIFPELLRPNIMKICNYLKKMKRKNKCSKIMIYTNNQGPKSWAENITKYIDNKLNINFFDQIVAAFKVNGEKVELHRTSHDKKFNDFIKCTKLNKDIELCFLDDRYHPDMDHENVYYINVKPYEYFYDFKEMVERFEKNEKFKNLINVNKNEFNNSMLNFIDKYCFKYNKKTNEELDIDEIVGKKILFHLKEFFHDNKKFTLKKKNKKKHKLTEKVKAESD